MSASSPPRTERQPEDLGPALLLRHQRAVRRHAERLCPNPSDASDLLSATFEAFFRHPEARTADEDRARALLLGICTNLSRHVRRSYARQSRAFERMASEPEAETPESPERLILRRESLAQLLEAVAVLPEDQRQTFLALTMEGLSSVEIAERDGLPAATVRSRLFHARKRLRSLLAPRVAGMLVVLVLVAGAAWAGRHALLRLLTRPRAIPAQPAPLLPALAPVPFGPAQAPLAPVPPALPLAPSPSHRRHSAALHAPASPTAVPALTPAHPGIGDLPLEELPGAKDAADERDFTAAFRAEFRDHAFADAVVGFSTYLVRHPDGRFLPEAHFNRALALLRMRKFEEARDDLEPLARGEYGTSRQADARALLDALSRGRPFH